MPRLDKYHEAVKNALIKDGWTITDDPLTVEYEDVFLYTDLGAERALAAIKGTEKIAVEIKVFGSRSLFSDFEKAIGQYQLYRLFLGKLEPDREVFMAISLEIFEESFQRPSIKLATTELGVKLLIVDVEKEEIKQWIN
ncbi:MAG: XisH family protein [Acidobacteriota bacterium]